MSEWNGEDRRGRAPEPWHLKKEINVGFIAGQTGIGSTKTAVGTDTGSEQSRGSQDEVHAGLNFSFK